LRPRGRVERFATIGARVVRAARVRHVDERDPNPSATYTDHDSAEASGNEESVQQRHTQRHDQWYGVDTASELALHVCAPSEHTRDSIQKKRAHSHQLADA
jgi:hypothetical protein